MYFLKMFPIKVLNIHISPVDLFSLFFPSLFLHIFVSLSLAFSLRLCHHRITSSNLSVSGAVWRSPRKQEVVQEVCCLQYIRSQTKSTDDSHQLIGYLVPSIYMCHFVCDFVFLLVRNLVLIHPSTQSRFHTIIHFYSALFIFFPSLSKTKAQLSLCLYTLQMNAYPCKFLKKKG